jgi:hypothetical protein
MADNLSSQGKPFEVRVNRLLLALLILIGFLFLFVGLDLAVLHLIFNPTVDNQLLMWIFNLFAIGIGIVLIISQGRYLIKPPLMMRISQEGISFGTGFGYKQQLIPWEYVESAGYGHGYVTMSANPFRDILLGVTVKFKDSKEIPSSLATSAGINYFNHTLFLNRLYMNKSAGKIIKVINSYLKKS